MKKIIVLAVILISGISLFSCTQESTADADALYDINATEGDDGEVEHDPDEN